MGKIAICQILRPELCLFMGAGRCLFAVMPLNLVADALDETIRPALPAKAASEADHRIANNLMIIAGLIRSQAARLPPGPTLPTEQVRDWLEEMSLRIDAVGRRHALLRADYGAGIGLLVAEAMTNAFKYSHPSGVPGTSTVTARRGRGLVIEIADDGVGLPESFDPNNGKSAGFRVMRAAADQVRGRLSFEQTPLGLRVRLEIPAA
jgi:two-component sensor histidine kinase